MAGYTTYIDLIKEIITDKKVISTGMMKEVDRVEAAIAEALDGKACSLISGGDAGIYAMAGLVFEMCQKKGLKLVRYCDSVDNSAGGAADDHSYDPSNSLYDPSNSLYDPSNSLYDPSNSSDDSANSSDDSANSSDDSANSSDDSANSSDDSANSSDDSANSSADTDDSTLEIEVVPGIPALAAGASLLGAPLTHDFAVISLSDLLTPWEKIKKRIEAAAAADFVIAIYNPRSKKRDWQLTKTMELILKHRPADTPVGVVTSAMRECQKITLTTLEDMDSADVGMQTILIVGNESSLQYLDFIYTPRGYSKKYNI